MQTPIILRPLPHFTNLIQKIVFIACALCAAMPGEAATFKRKFGAAITGEVLSVNKDGIVFKTIEGRITVRIPYYELDEADISRDEKVKTFRATQPSATPPGGRPGQPSAPGLLDSDGNPTLPNVGLSISSPGPAPEVQFEDIRRQPDKYLNQSVQMKGALYSQATNRWLFNLSQGGQRRIDVLYDGLPPEKRAAILQQRKPSAFEAIAVTVVGTVHRQSPTSVYYEIRATDVVMSAPAPVQRIQYTDILLQPEEYIERIAQMKGTFDYKVTETQSFYMTQGDNKIDVFYENLPLEKQALILQQKNFSKTAVTVVGTVKRFNNRQNTYYIMATDVVFR